MLNFENPLCRTEGQTMRQTSIRCQHKSSLAVLASGMGMTQANKFLTTLNIPHFQLKTQKIREREIGPVIEQVSSVSCEVACAEERLLLKAAREASANSDESVEPNTGSYDMGWSKRGKGMNSATGVGAIIGMESCKVLAFDTRVKKCRVCEHYQREQMDVPSHDCRRNWKKSCPQNCSPPERPQRGHSA